MGAAAAAERGDTGIGRPEADAADADAAVEEAREWPAVERPTEPDDETDCGGCK